MLDCIDVEKLRDLLSRQQEAHDKKLQSITREDEVLWLKELHQEAEDFMDSITTQASPTLSRVIDYLEGRNKSAHSV